MRVLYVFWRSLFTIHLRDRFHLQLLWTSRQEQRAARLARQTQSPDSAGNAHTREQFEGQFTDEEDEDVMQRDFQAKKVRIVRIWSDNCQHFAHVSF